MCGKPVYDGCPPPPPFPSLSCTADKDLRFTVCLAELVLGRVGLVRNYQEENFSNPSSKGSEKINQVMTFPGKLHYSCCHGLSNRGISLIEFLLLNGYTTQKVKWQKNSKFKDCLLSLSCVSSKGRTRKRLGMSSNQSVKLPSLTDLLNYRHVTLLPIVFKQVDCFRFLYSVAQIVGLFLTVLHWACHVQIIAALSLGKVGLTTAIRYALTRRQFRWVCVGRHAFSRQYENVSALLFSFVALFWRVFFLKKFQLSLCHDFDGIWEQVEHCWIAFFGVIRSSFISYYLSSIFFLQGR